MSLVIPVFVGVGDGGQGSLNFRGGGGDSEKESLQILYLQRLASLYLSHRK